MSDGALAAVAFVVSAILALAAFVPMRQKARKDAGGRAKAKPIPPQDPAVKAARVLVQEEMEKRIDEVTDAATGDSPADDLAALGNKRKRR